MRQSKAALAIVAVLMVTLSVPALARGRSGGGHGGHSFSGARAPSGHAFSGGRASAGHFGSHRSFGGHGRIGVFIGVPLFAPLFYPPPVIYAPPQTYIEQAPSQSYWYFCPELNAYYPYVQQCPGGWQQVVPQSSAP